VIICFETGKRDVNKNLARRAIEYFPDGSHHFYISKEAFKHPFKQYHNYINDPNHANKAQLPSLQVCMTYYNKFINKDPPITED
jgi:hypothetical protein